MRKLISKVILSAILILSYPKKIFASVPTSLGGEATAGVPLPPPQETFITPTDQILHWIFLPLGVLAVVFYSIYFLLKKKKKSKKVYLYIANIILLLVTIILIAWAVFDFIGETNHYHLFN